ncbi:uncharacterized protein LOC132684285 [Panthera onca]
MGECVKDWPCALQWGQLGRQRNKGNKMILLPLLFAPPEENSFWKCQRRNCGGAALRGPLDAETHRLEGGKCSRFSQCQEGHSGSKPLQGVEQVSKVPAFPKSESWLDPVGGGAWTKPRRSPGSRAAGPTHLPDISWQGRVLSGGGSPGLALLRTGRQGVATSGAGEQALGVGRASELRAGAGEWAAGGSRCGLPARSSPSAAHSRAPLLPPRPLLSIPPTEPSAALQWLVRGRGAPSGSVLRVPQGREVGGHRAPPRNPPSLAGDCRGWGVTGTVRSPPAPRPPRSPWTQAPELSTARGVSGGQGRGRGAEWRPAHPAPHSRTEGTDKGEGPSKRLLKCPLPAPEAPR